MTERNSKKLNWLEQNLPEGLLVTASWLTRHGYSTSLRTQYVAAGWLNQPARGVYRRSRAALRWEQVVISLQGMLSFPVVVGGRTALELQGYAHFLPQEMREVHLYGRNPLPPWPNKLPLPTHFVFHRTTRLFPGDPVVRGLTTIKSGGDTEALRGDHRETDVAIQPWGQWDWPLALSSPERALLELLDELPDKESFNQVDKLVEGLVNLRPGRLQKLLEECGSVKVKRLFFFFADRHVHAWHKRIDSKAINLGKGKRMLVRGGKLDRTYQITVPEDLDAVQ